MSERAAPSGTALLDRLFSPLGVGLLATVLVALAAGPWPVGVFFDDGLYLVLAKSLATGEGYRYLNLPDAPIAAKYPPAWPALLALLWRIAPRFPENVLLFKLANACLMGVAAGGVAHLAHRRLAIPRMGAALVGLASAATIPVLATATVLFSEPLFLALLVPTLLVADRAAEAGRTRDAVVAGALCGGLVLVRAIGVAAPAAAVLVLLLRRRPVPATVLAATAALVVAPWHLYLVAAAEPAALPEALRASYGTYGSFVAPALRGDGLAFLADVAARNLKAFPRIFGALFTPAPWLRPLALLGCLALAIVGAARLARRAPTTAAFLAIYLGIVVVWPYTPDRFLWGIWTLVLATLAAGIATAGERARTLHERFRRGERPAWRGIAAHAALAAGALVVCAGFVHNQARGLAGRWWESAQRRAAEQAVPLLAWAATTDPDAVLASDFEPMIYLYTARRTVPASAWNVTEYVAPPPSSSERAALEEVLARYRPRYLLATSPGSSAGRAARLLLGDTPPALVVHQSLPNGGAVFAPTRQ